MGIYEVAKGLGLEPIRHDSLVAFIVCPWCGARMNLALSYDRFACTTCDEAGTALQLLDRIDPPPLD